MSTNWHDLIQSYICGTITDAEARSLEQQLKIDASLRDLYLDMLNLDSALEAAAESAQIALSLPVPLTQRVLSPTRPVPTVWFSWHPLTAAAAGVMFGMLCTSVVFGWANQRLTLNRLPLVVFDAGLEDERQLLKDGFPDRPAQWGMDDASIVTAEGQIQPLQGKRMMRMKPIPREKPVKNHTSRLYQLVDLRSQSMAIVNGEAEAEVSASFCAASSNASSRYLIRAIALDEAPETATKNFWSKVESDGVVSESQRFDTKSGEAGWHTFSMKLRLPPGSKTLALIFGAVPPEDTSRSASVHYFDNVQVTLLTPEPLP
jgi:hypothetical protein